MDERRAFAELLQDMLEQAQINGNRISQSEIQEFFEDLNLSDEQMNHIYSYLVAHQITIQGMIVSAETKQNSKQYQTFGQIEEKREREQKKTSVKKGQSRPKKDSVFLQMYLQELNKREQLTNDQERELVEKLLRSTVLEPVFAEELKERFIHHKLYDVVNRARSYVLGGEALEELIQEGNIGLMLAMQNFDQYQEAEAFLTDVEKQIAACMEAYIDRMYESGSEEQVMVAKVHFVSEAAKAMKEENGQEPTLAEMAAYTNLTEEELLAIINLSADNLKI